MSYQWSTPTPVVRGAGQTTFGNDDITIEAAFSFASENRDQGQLVELLGQIKDACEGAGITVGEITSSASDSVFLEEA